MRKHRAAPRDVRHVLRLESEWQIEEKEENLTFRFHARVYANNPQILHERTIRPRFDQPGI